MNTGAKVYRLALDKPKSIDLAMFGPYMGLNEAQAMRETMANNPLCRFPVVVVNTSTHAFLTNNARGF